LTIREKYTKQSLERGDTNTTIAYMARQEQNEMASSTPWRRSMDDYDDRNTCIRSQITTDNSSPQSISITLTPKY
jgi:hypothetical protein